MTSLQYKDTALSATPPHDCRYFMEQLRYASLIIVLVSV